ncbi:hypothetical protein [Planosporangium mesophilum]|nr:hypothetical protein [Planosporangium mesophilum]
MVLILESRSHLDLGDLPNMLAAELGVMTVRLERAVRSLDGVARVHVNRWGDGSAHLHLWFLARPAGRLQLRGTFLSLWDEILPPIPEHQWRENLALVAAWLAEFGGTPLAEPPRIDWKSPATLTPVAQSGPDANGPAAAGGALATAAEAPTPDVSESEAARDRGAAPDDPATTSADGEGTPGAPAPSGDDATAVPAVPGESASTDEIRVVPGPSGFPPIGEPGTQRRTRAADKPGPVPGQRDGSADGQGQRDGSADGQGQRDGSADSRDPAASTPA